VLEGVLVCNSCHDEVARPARIETSAPAPRVATPLSEVLDKLLDGA
jgi:hypothetical protein